MLEWVSIIALAIIAPFAIIFLLSILAGGFSIGVISSLIMVFILLGLSGFLIFLGLLIAPTYPKIGKYLAYGGVVGLMILLLIIETSIIGISGYKIGKNYVSGNFWSSCTSTPNSIISFLTCSITGHQPLPSSTKDIWGFFGVYGFYLFGLFVPLIILVALFADFVEVSGVVQNPTYQKIIGFGLGFMAYRGFVVTKLIYILDIGSTGIAVIALNFIWLGGVLGYIRRSFRQWQLLEAEQELATDMPRLARNLQAIANNWRNKEMVAASFSDPVFMRNLTLIVGAVKAQQLADQSTKANINEIRQKVHQAINEAIK